MQGSQIDFIFARNEIALFSEFSVKCVKINKWGFSLGSLLKRYRCKYKSQNWHNRGSGSAY